MKSTGIVRQLDALGRVVLPAELRRTYGITKKDALEIFTHGSDIILRIHKPSCIFCDNADRLADYNGARLCPECIEKISKLSIPDE